MADIEALIARLDQLRGLTYPGNRIFVLCVEVADVLREQRAENEHSKKYDELRDILLEDAAADLKAEQAEIDRLATVLQDYRWKYAPEILWDISAATKPWNEPLEAKDIPI